MAEKKKLLIGGRDGYAMSDADNYREHFPNIEFMEKAVKVRNNWLKKIPAVVHVDNTARVQTVSEKFNPTFYRLIKEFYKITNVPVILNTSFNLNGEPIVMTPSDAIRTFHTCGLDTLVLENYVIEK